MALDEKIRQAALANIEEVLAFDVLKGCGEPVEFGVKMLVGALWVGPNIVRLASLLKAPRSRVREYSMNLRRSEVWCRNTMFLEWLADDAENADVGVMLDAMVAAGIFLRKRSVEGPDAKDPYRCSITSLGIALCEAMGKEKSSA